MTIWIDADAAPRACKEIVFRASLRLELPVVMVANQWQTPPKSKWVSFVQVDKGLDVADDYIVEHATDGDLCITNDIPLAAELIDKGVSVIRPRGEVLDESNIGQRLAMRDFMDELRGGGVHTGGPSAYGSKEKQSFANALDRWLTRHR